MVVAAHQNYKAPQMMYSVAKPLDFSFFFASLS